MCCKIWLIIRLVTSKFSLKFGHNSFFTSWGMRHKLSVQSRLINTNSKKISLLSTNSTENRLKWGLTIFQNNHQRVIMMHWVHGQNRALVIQGSWQWRDHSFSMYAKFPEKITLLTPWYAHVRKRIRELEIMVFRKILRT